MLLVRQCWGAYVALISAEDGVFAMADPSGAGRAHLCEDDDLAMLADVVTPDMCRAAGFDATVRGDVLAGGLVDPSTLIVGSALTNVKCLPPGTLIPLLPGGEEAILWSPADVATGGDRRDDSVRLVGAVDAAVHGLRGVRPLVQTSGGLDSAIVLAAAARLGAAEAFTVVGESGDVDESSYARDAAAKCGVGLTVARDADLPDFRSFMDALQIAHPFLHGLDDVFDRRMEEAASAFGCDRVLTGQGGDAVFLQLASPTTSADRLADLGLRGLLSELLDDAARMRTSIWRPLAGVARHLLRGTPPPVASPLTPHLLTADALASAARHHHPWTEGRWPRHPGRALHVRLLANATVVHTRRPRVGTAPLVSPLLSQPMLEAVLATPTWKLASGPLDRGLARSAFAARLPGSIARRTTKGQATMLFSRAVERNLPLLRERLLDGALTRRRVLDRLVLERVLTREHLAHSADFRSLMFVAACEAWASAWE